MKVVSLGITNQRETTVVWDRATGKPLYNAVVWLDNRTSAICSAWEERVGGRDYFRPVTGLPISTYFSAFKFQWLYEHVPAVRAAAAAGTCLFGTVDSWLIYCLTGDVKGGVHVTDVTNAARTMLMDLGTLQWHQPYVELFGMRPDMLPRIVSNVEVYGHVAEGPLEGVPISGCLGDQMAAMLGQRCVQGEAKNTYGTGCFMLLNTGPTPQPSKAGLLTTVAFQLGPSQPAQYALEGSVAVAGLGVSWLQSNLGVIEDAQESETLARQVPTTGGVYFVPAFSGLLAPHWDATARGVIAGLSGSSTRAHVVRAMLEAVCYQTREVLDAMKRDAGLQLKALRVDGGATKNNLLMQLQADILQVPVLRPVFQETTSMGAALAAGLAVGFWTLEEVFDHSSQQGSTAFSPEASTKEADRRYSCWQKAVGLCHGLVQLGDPEEGEQDEGGLADADRRAPQGEANS